jgi:hypothetical protein
MPLRSADKSGCMFLFMYLLIQGVSRRGTSGRPHGDIPRGADRAGQRALQPFQVRVKKNDRFDRTESVVFHRTNWKHTRT